MIDQDGRADGPIKQGGKVVLYYASANRDEDVFTDPHTFDVGRTPNDHVTFGGGGEHFCLGASLARAEIKATMRQIVERLPDLELAGNLPYGAQRRLEIARALATEPSEMAQIAPPPMATTAPTSQLTACQSMLRLAAVKPSRSS